MFKKTIKLLKTKISKQKIEWVKNEILLGYKKNLGNFFKNSNKYKISIKKEILKELKYLKIK